MSQHTKCSPKIGVLLVNLGTPESPTPTAVRHYLKAFLSDIRVVDTPRWLWWFILRVILIIRPKSVAKAYKSIWWKDGSPLMVITRRQQVALQNQLTSEGLDIPVAIAMTYGNPTMEQAASELRASGVQEIIVLPLYPQNSSSTIAAVFDRLASALKPCPHVPKLHFINGYHLHPDYINALKKSVLAHWEEHGQSQKLLMSFHGIPQSYEDKGDPYPTQCRETAQAVAESLGLKDDQWACTFQSRFGRAEWVKPYTDFTLKDWGQNGVESVDVISPAFAADCLETLEELEVENREYFIENGGKAYRYIPALNDNPLHIKMMVSLIKDIAD